MSTLAQYRARVPAHSAVADALITTYLDDAIACHTYSKWNAVYDAAMVAWAASRIEAYHVAGAAQEITASGDVCAPPTRVDGAVVSPPKPEDTTYWAQYLAYRNSRAAAQPRHVGPACT